MFLYRSTFFLARSFAGAKGDCLLPACQSNWQCQEKLDRPRDEILMFLQVVALLLFLTHLSQGGMKK